MDDRAVNFLGISQLKDGDLELKWLISRDKGEEYFLKLNILLKQLIELENQECNHLTS